jgi:hypothetical protein
MEASPWPGKAAAPQTWRQAMSFEGPFRLGPFLVDTQGRVQPSEPGHFPRFHAVWRGCPVQASLDADGAAEETAAPGGAANLLLSAIVGRVPSTAGADAARNQQRRSAAFGALQALVGGAAQGPHLRLLPDHRVAMQAVRPVAMPASAADLLTQITCFLLDLGPYLDLLAEADVPVEAVGAAVSSSGGTAKT